MSRRREGRPPLPSEPLTRNVGVRLTGATFERLEAESKRRGATVSDLIREAVDEYLEDDG